MRRSLVLAAVAILVAAAHGGAAHATPTNVADNGLTNGVLSGPAVAYVGLPATYTLVISLDSSFGGLAYTDPNAVTISVPAGAADITISDSSQTPGTTCAPKTYAVSPVNYTSCDGYALGSLGDPAVTFTITLTPTAVTPAFTIGATVSFIRNSASATFTSAVQVVPTNLSTLTLPQHVVGPLPFSGAGFDPRCLYGCPPTGLP